MAVPGIPTSFVVQQGNGQVLLTWDLMAGATSYKVQRSSDGVTYSLLASPTVNKQLDTTATVNTQYFYKVAATNSSGDSSYTTAQSIIPTLAGLESLGSLRLQAQQRADRVGSNFVGTAEWNSYINKAADELYDLLTTLYEDYNITSPVTFSLTGASQYNLTTVAPNFYKLNGVDLGLNTSGPAWVTLKKYDFIARNRYVYPQITSNILGINNLRYRLVGATLMFIPTPASGQTIQLWYTPRRTQLLNDTDVLDGINGWTEYVIVRAAKYALDKEESDTTKLDQELMFMKGRIEESAMNRDAGEPDTVSDLRSWSGGLYGPPNGDGSHGGY